MHQRLQINGSIMVRRWPLGAAVSHFGRALSLCESGATRRFIARDWHFADRDHLSPAGGKVVCLAAIFFGNLWSERRDFSFVEMEQVGV